uniref:Uncharacterized protein n=1 Tax=Cacopsylla melanoneura TaxID=428564 RepID=A0A8D9E668_9HEMI
MCTFFFLSNFQFWSNCSCSLSLILSHPICFLHFSSCLSQVFFNFTPLLSLMSLVSCFSNTPLPPCLSLVSLVLYFYQIFHFLCVYPSCPSSYVSQIPHVLRVYPSSH